MYKMHNLIQTIDQPVGPTPKNINTFSNIDGFPTFLTWVLAAILLVDKVSQYLVASKNVISAYHRLTIEQLTHHKNIENKLAQLYALTNADRAIIGIFKGYGSSKDSFYKKTLTAKYEVTNLSPIKDSLQGVPLRKLVDDLLLNSTRTYRVVQRHKIERELSDENTVKYEATSNCMAYLDTINIEQKDIIFLGSSDNIEGILELQYTKETLPDKHWLENPILKLQGYKLTNQIRHSLNVLLNPSDNKFKRFFTNLFC